MPTHNASLLSWPRKEEGPQVKSQDDKIVDQPLTNRQETGSRLNYYPSGGSPTETLLQL